MKVLPTKITNFIPRVPWDKVSKECVKVWSSHEVKDVSIFIKTIPTST